MEGAIILYNSDPSRNQIKRYDGIKRTFLVHNQTILKYCHKNQQRNTQQYTSVTSIHYRHKIYIKLSNSNYRSRHINFESYWFGWHLFSLCTTNQTFPTTSFGPAWRKNRTDLQVGATFIFGKLLKRREVKVGISHDSHEKDPWKNGVYTYMTRWCLMLNVGKYTYGYMDPIGFEKL